MFISSYPDVRTYLVEDLMCIKDRGLVIRFRLPVGESIEVGSWVRICKKGGNAIDVKVLAFERNFDLLMASPHVGVMVYETLNGVINQGDKIQVRSISSVG
jgi:hypothetical protein